MQSIAWPRALIHLAGHPALPVPTSPVETTISWPWGTKQASAWPRRSGWEREGTVPQLQGHAAPCMDTRRDAAHREALEAVCHGVDVTSHVIPAPMSWTAGQASHATTPACAPVLVRSVWCGRTCAWMSFEHHRPSVCDAVPSAGVDVPIAQAGRTGRVKASFRPRQRCFARLVCASRQSYYGRRTLQGVVPRRQRFNQRMLSKHS